MQAVFWMETEVSRSSLIPYSKYWVVQQIKGEKPRRVAMSEYYSVARELFDNTAEAFHDLYNRELVKKPEWAEGPDSPHPNHWLVKE